MLRRVPTPQPSAPKAEAQPRSAAVDGHGGTPTTKGERRPAVGLTAQPAALVKLIGLLGHHAARHCNRRPRAEDDDAQ
jgi:hypothetical protein